jgi:hypothetical protein
MQHHKNITDLIGYWSDKNVGFKAPLRAAIYPGDFLAVLPQILIVGRQAKGTYPVRLAGGFVDLTLGRSPHRRNLLDLFDRDSHAIISGLIENSRVQVEPCVLSAQGQTRTGSVRHYQLMMAPMTGPTGLSDRFLCLLQPLTVQFEGDDIRISSLTLTHADRTAYRPAAFPALVTDNGRHVA